jgi:hypothetical protein
MYLPFFLLLVQKKETKKKTPKKMLPFAHASATPLFWEATRVFHSLIGFIKTFGFMVVKDW